MKDGSRGPSRAEIVRSPGNADRALSSSTVGGSLSEWGDGEVTLTMVKSNVGRGLGFQDSARTESRVV